MDFQSEEKQRERQHRRKLIADWKAESKAIRAADPGKRMLMKEAKQMALARIESAARTETQFENVTRLWDDREIVENWRTSKRVESYASGLPEGELSDLSVVIPQPLNHTYWRQLLNGDFLDYIHDCPHELCETTSSGAIQDLLYDLDGTYLEILYYWAIRYWTPQQIAAFCGKTDRNIRKVYGNMIDTIRKKLCIRLFPRYSNNLPLTVNQQEFCKSYISQLDKGEKAKLMRQIEEEERSKRKADRGGKHE